MGQCEVSQEFKQSLIKRLATTQCDDDVCDDDVSDDDDDDDDDDEYQ